MQPVTGSPVLLYCYRVRLAPYSSYICSNHQDLCTFGAVSYLLSMYVRNVPRQVSLSLSRAGAHVPPCCRHGTSRRYLFMYFFYFYFSRFSFPSFFPAANPGHCAMINSLHCIRTGNWHPVLHRVPFPIPHSPSSHWLFASARLPALSSLCSAPGPGNSTTIPAPAAVTSTSTVLRYQPICFGWFPAPPSPPHAHTTHNTRQSSLAFFLLSLHPPFPPGTFNQRHQRLVFLGYNALNLSKATLPLLNIDSSLASAPLESLFSLGRIIPRRTLSSCHGLLRDSRQSSFRPYLFTFPTQFCLSFRTFFTRVDLRRCPVSENLESLLLLSCSLCTYCRRRRRYRHNESSTVSTVTRLPTTFPATATSVVPDA
ncbi:hypothetical protein GGR55DRAFT_521422 [Xylaria sp. FL0064]|nr:hypothetical protein GGR55DRAFT_521422 [Xylaria sp. FL0064]